MGIWHPPNVVFGQTNFSEPQLSYLEDEDKNSWLKSCGDKRSPAYLMLEPHTV